MSKLSLADQAMYKMESAGMSHMNMGGAVIVDPSDAADPLDADALALHLMARMETIPLMRTKVVQDPLKLGAMRKVADPAFDVRNHVRRITLKKPGGYAQLADTLSEISARNLDRSRPLWSAAVIDGMERGLIAVVLTIHHCLADGSAAMKALGSIWDVEPVPAERPTSGAWIADDEPSQLELVGGALKENVERIAKAPYVVIADSPNLVKAAVNELKKSFKKSQREVDVADKVTVPKVRKTSINVSSVSRKRSLSFLEFPLSEIKALCGHYECSINDVVIALSSNAMTHYFNGIGEPIDFDLTAVMTVNTRPKDAAEEGNAASFARISLYNNIDDFGDRLRAIVADTTVIKKSVKEKVSKRSSANDKSGFDAAKLTGLFSPIVLDTVFLGVVKLDVFQKTGLCAGNVVITNVPGSPVPLYLATAKQVSVAPTAPVIDTFGLTIAATSTYDKLFMSFHGCGEAIQRADLFVEGAELCFRRLREQSGVAAKVPPKPNRRPASSGTRT